MAHRILHKAQGIMLSSAIGEIDIDVDGTSVDVTLTGPGGKTILSERYYAYSGRVTLYNLGSLIEAELRSSGYTTADYTLRVFSDTVTNKADSCTLKILYCDRYAIGYDVPLFLKENFLTTLAMRRVAPQSIISLFFYAEKGESLEYTIFHRFRKQSSDAMYSHSFIMQSEHTANSAGVEQINISIDEIIADAASFATARLGEIEPLSFTVRLGQRSISFFIDPTLSFDNTFYFRNCFNVWDWAALPCVTTAKSAVDRSTAIVNGTSQFYDQSVEKTYEVEAGPLTSDEAEWIDQLFTSYDVFRIEPDATNSDDPYLFAPILITDSTCEVHNADNKLNSVKFSWRYADNRPCVRLSASPGIFTESFNYVYS